MNGVRYPAGLIAEAVRMYVEDELSSADVARSLGLKPFTVKGWLSERGLIRSMSEAASLSVAKRPRGRATSRLWFADKSGYRHFAESSLEFLRMVQLDKDSSVASWERCRLRVPYAAPGGRIKNYVPDFTVARVDGTIEIEETKPLSLIPEATNQAKFAACILFCGERGWRFKVLSERDVGYVRALAPSALSKSEKAERSNLLRRQRWARETPEQRAIRLANNAAAARNFRARSREATQTCGRRP